MNSWPVTWKKAIEGIRQIHKQRTEQRTTPLGRAGPWIVLKSPKGLDGTRSRRMAYKIEALPSRIRCRSW